MGNRKKEEEKWLQEIAPARRGLADAVNDEVWRWRAGADSIRSISRSSPVICAFNRIRSSFNEEKAMLVPAFNNVGKDRHGRSRRPHAYR